MNISSRAFLEERVNTFTAMLFYVGSQLTLVVGIQDTKLEGRQVRIGWVPRSFEHNGKSQHPYHLGNLAQIPQVKLPRTGDAQSSSQVKI